MAVSGGYAYVADASAGLRVLAIAEPANPQEVSVYDTPGSAEAVAVGDGYVYLADHGWGLLVFPPVTFADVPFGHWAYEQILECVDATIVAGYDDGCYHPDWPVTRDQMAVYISRALAGGDDNVPPDSAYPTPSFTDVDSDDWAYNYIEYAVDQNVVQGYEYPDPDIPDETISLYEPLWTVTRDQMAVYVARAMVARAMVAPTGEAALADYIPADPRNFPDVPATGYGDDGTDPFWAYTHIEYCVEHAVVNGYADGYYYPENPVTRDQMAVFIARAFQLPL